MSNRAITEAILKLTGLHKVDQVYYATCTVNSVDIATRTCDCSIIDGNVASDLPGVLLMSEVDDGLLIEPVVGSTIKVLFSRDVDPIAVQFSEIANVTLITSGLIALNGTNYGGLIKLMDPNNPQAGILSKLNNLESSINNLKTLLTTWIPVPTDGGAALKTIITEWSGMQLTETLSSDLENANITHGQ